MARRIPSLSRIFQPVQRRSRVAGGGGGNSAPVITVPGAQSVWWSDAIDVVEAVTQQGVADIPAVAEVVTITASGLLDTTVDSNGNSVSTDGDGAYSGSSAASGWTAGAPTGESVTFTCDTTGPKNTTKASGNGSVTVDTAGADVITGQPEIHTLTRSKAPADGTWACGGNTTAFDATPSVSGWTFNQSLVDGVITATTTTNTNASDTALAPDGSGLTGSDGIVSLASISFADADGDALDVTVDVSHGTVTFPVTSGLTVGGSGTASVTLSGPVVYLNQAFDSAYYKPTSTYAGSDTLSIGADDGNPGGTDSETVAISVVNPTPDFLWQLNEASGTRSQSGTVSSADLTDNNTVGNGDGDGVYAPSGLGASVRVAKFVRSANEFLSLADLAGLSIGASTFVGGLCLQFSSSLSSYRSLYNKGGAGKEEFSLYYDVVAGRFKFQVSADGSSWTAVTADALGAPTNGMWYVILFWVDADSDELGISINGSANTTSFSSSVYDGDGMLRIGTASDGASEPHDGYGCQAFLDIGSAPWSATQKTWYFNSNNGRLLS